jgi:hypothetical protein
MSHLPTSERYTIDSLTFMNRRIDTESTHARLAIWYDFLKWKKNYMQTDASNRRIKWDILIVAIVIHIMDRF